MNSLCRFYFARLAAKTNFEAIMTWKEKIILALREELEPLGFRHLKSQRLFGRQVDRDIKVGMSYIIASYHRGFTDVELLAQAEYRYLEDVIYQLNNLTVAKSGHFGIAYNLRWLIPDKEYKKDPLHMDLVFRDNDSEETNQKKLEGLIIKIREYILPSIERMAKRDSAIEVTIELDRSNLIFIEGVVPVMYCLWKHDKKTALDYLEEKRLRLLEKVEPWEWELLDRYKNGERFGGIKQIKNGVAYGTDNPSRAYAYDDFIEKAKLIKEWINNQTY